ncbi:MAG: iron chelate uptake ABC transporter family permease subunit [Symbiopectobacterium sp.]|uniref:iron chelate uptake ABC transporter family permease subunit n=1 Tax=Symbiopectobacterium sp. TaxID=2952789 RepID=UPI0039E7E60B
MRTATLFTLLSTLALLCIALAVFSGAYPLSLRQVIGLFFSPDSHLPQDQIVFWQIRLPRIAAALLIGAALAHELADAGRR